jgi:ABC-2 type transport system permease protein
MRGGGFASLSRAMFLGFIRDRTALIFSILLPVLFLVFGSIYRNSSAPKISLIEVGQVRLLSQARHADPGVARVLAVRDARSLTVALDAVRTGNDDAAVLQRGGHIIVRYSIADQTKAGLVNSVLASIVQAANQAASGERPRFTLSASQVEDKSLKPIQYVTPGLLGWALASGATFGAAITLVSWRQNKLLRRLRLAPIGTGSIVAARIGIALAIGLIQLAVFLAIANLIILPMAFVGGAFIPLDFAPDWVRQASYAMPLRYLVTAMQDVMARGEGPNAALPAIGILLGFTLVAGLAAIRLFRWDDI